MKKDTKRRPERTILPDKDPQINDNPQECGDAIESSGNLHDKFTRYLLLIDQRGFERILLFLVAKIIVSCYGKLIEQKIRVK